MTSLHWTENSWVSGSPQGYPDGQIAWVPGFVNAHSHAFQHAMRARAEYATPGGDDFWTWRNAMYELALSLGPEELYQVSKDAFSEMRQAGIVHVGEFHYVHHAQDGSRYAEPNELAHQVIRAAQDAGIGITLLLVAYHRAGFGRAAEPHQRRFVEPTLDGYLSRVEALLERYKGADGVNIGVAPHSIRAVPAEWLSGIRDFAVEHGIPLHIHANEQVREIEESKAEYGKPPVLVFDELGLFEAHTTLVHATHLSVEELDVLGRAKPVICACPTTERNLGDGFLPALELVKRDVPICIGSDSHTQVDFIEEMRIIEYHERLRYQRRNVLAQVYSERVGGPVETGDVLLPMSSKNGALSLGLDSVDWIGFDLEHPALKGWTEQTLSSHLVLCTSGLRPLEA